MDKAIGARARQDRRRGVAIAMWLAWLSMGWASLVSISQASVPVSQPIPLSAPLPAPQSGLATAAATPVDAPRFVRFGPAQGLSMTLNDLVVDRQGYVWVATGDGLARYDGEGFRFWRRELGREASLPDNEITVLHVDARDRLWAASWDRLSVLDPPLRTPRVLRFDAETRACASDITAIDSEPSGRLWLSTQTGAICTIDANGRSARLRLPVDPFAGGHVLSLRVRGPRSLLVGAENGLWRVSIDGAVADVARVESAAIGRAPIPVLSPAGQGALWVGADAGPVLLGADDRPRALPWRAPEGGGRAAVLRARDGTHWIGGYFGLFRRSPGDDGVRASDTGFGIDDGVFRIVEDREGGLWFASYSQGLFYLPVGHDRFRVVPLTGDARGDVLAGAHVLSADGDARGDLWVLGTQGLFRIRADRAEAVLEADPPRLAMRGPRAVRACADGRLAIADSGGVLLSDAQARRWRRVLTIAADQQGHAPETLHCDRQGRIWVSLLGGGMLLLDPEGRVLRRMRSMETLGGDVGAFIDLRFDPLGQPWYSDGRDLRRWDGARFVRVSLPAGEYVYALAFADPQTLWIARFGGIERYRWDGRALHLQQRIDGDDGVPAAEVRSLAVAENGSVWSNGVRGLVHYDPKQDRVRVLGLRDGLPELDFTTDVLATAANGDLLALGERALVRFDPTRPLSAPQASALSIETLALRRGEDTVWFADEVVMRPGDRDLRVAARVMSFADPAAHRYRFRLRGYDPDWVRQGDQGERGERIFSSLPPGRYVLEIQGANADGVWSPTRRVAIRVEAPWWRTWWAFSLYALAASALVLWLARIDRARLRRRHNYQLIQQKRALAEQASEAKSRFLANLGHEVRTPMTGVLGMSELLLSAPLDPQQRARVQAIRRAGEHLLGLVNDALDLARIEAGRFEPAQLDFELLPLIDDAVALMRPLAERKGLRFVVDVDDALRGGWRGDPTRLRQILLNLLGNAIKFTERGEVALSLAPLAPQGLFCIVRDTGPGLDAEQQRRLFRRFEQAEGARTASRYGGSGLGLAICQELAVAMGGGIEVRSAPGEGACFVVRLPLPRVALPVATPASMRTSPRQGRAILLVEDDPIVADALSGLLQAQGHRVAHAAHALAALTANASDEVEAGFDLALIDLDLPGMDGLALARLLRTQGFDRPMIAITARADAEAETQALAAGFDAFLRKPLTGETLGATIESRARDAQPI